MRLLSSYYFGGASFAGWFIFFLIYSIFFFFSLDTYAGDDEGEVQNVLQNFLAGLADVRLPRRRGTTDLFSRC